MKVVINDTKTGKSYQKEIEETRPFHGIKIGEEFDGSLVGLSGYKLVVTGGTTDSGFPMRKDIHGSQKTRALLGSGPGFKPKNRGQRRRKTVRGNTVAEDIAQINSKISKYGAKSVEEALGKKEESQQPEGEKPAEEKQAEAKPAEKPEKKEAEAAEKPVEEKPAKEEKKEKKPGQKEGGEKNPEKEKEKKDKGEEKKE